jgi:hypothetical protein
MNKIEPLNKTKVEAAYVYLQKLLKKKNKKTIQLTPNSKIIIDYRYCWSYGDGIHIDINATTTKLSGELLKFATICGYNDFDFLTDEIDMDQYFEIDDYQDEFDVLCQIADIDINEQYWMFYQIDSTTFEHIWQKLETYFIDPNKPKIDTIKLNKNYSAIIDTKNKTVQVGCQTIPIENVRKIVEEYDKSK